MKYYNDVKQFHDKFGLVTPPNFITIPRDLFEFRVKFFREEFDEYVESVMNNDLPNAIDALIDLVYITCGAALLTGIYPFEENHGTYKSLPIGIPANPALLSRQEHLLLTGVLNHAINDYVLAYDENDQEGIELALNDLYFSSIAGAQQMGFYEVRWNMLWDDVQRANMTKERAVKATQSKRGSTYDVFKPAGWVGPQTQKLVGMMVRGEA